MILACVIGKDWKDDQGHLVGQMIDHGEPLHARGQTDEVLLGFGLDILADSNINASNKSDFFIFLPMNSIFQS